MPSVPKRIRWQSAKLCYVGSSPIWASSFMKKFSYLLSVLGLLLLVSVAADNAFTHGQILLLVAGVLISIIAYIIRAFHE